MDEQRLRTELRARDRATRPDERFSDQLFARLATDLQLRPAAQSDVRRSARSPRRWLAAVALALLTVGSIGMLAFLARQDDHRLACTPELAADAAQRLRDVPGYTYRLEGWLEIPSRIFVGGQMLPRRSQIVIEGEVASDGAHERYLSGGEHAFGAPPYYHRTDAAIQVADTLWLRNYIGADPDRPWMRVKLVGLDVDDPNLAGSTADRLPRMVEGPAAAPPATWTVVDEEVVADATICTLRDERHWSAASDAVRTVTLRVNADTALPVSIDETWQGFATRDNSVGRQFDVTVAYPDVAPSIVAPPADQVSPNLDQMEPSEDELLDAWQEPEQTIVAPGEVTIITTDGPYAKVAVTEVVERAYEGITAMPGTVFLSFYSRHESLRDRPEEMWAPGSDWYFMAHGPGFPPSPPTYFLDTYIVPYPEPLLAGGRPAVGRVFEGWLTVQVPAEGEVSMWFLHPISSEARVILRPGSPGGVQESPAASP